MTTLLEKILTFLAPHDCIFCGNEGNVACAACMADVVDEAIYACHVCGLPTVSGQACVDCRAKSSLEAIFALGLHEAELRRLVAELKFAHARQVARDVAPSLAGSLPFMARSTVVTYLPTSYTRARERGFDQAELLARAVAEQRQLTFDGLLRRHGNARQVGARRADRFDQAKTMFSMRTGVSLAGKTIVLVDDVVTTGASMEAAGAILRAAGAERVFGLALARGSKIGKFYGKPTGVRGIIRRS